MHINWRVKMEYIYKTKGGVCSSKILLDVEDGIVKSVKFKDGCDGNTHGIETLVIGMPVDEVIAKLKGIKCGYKKTSCPDQLANALMELQNK